PVTKAAPLEKGRKAPRWRPILLLVRCGEGSEETDAVEAHGAFVLLHPPAAPIWSAPPETTEARAIGASTQLERSSHAEANQGQRENQGPTHRARQVARSRRRSRPPGHVLHQQRSAAGDAGAGGRRAGSGAAAAGEDAGPPAAHAVPPSTLRQRH